jgi:hypothetical protein
MPIRLRRPDGSLPTVPPPDPPVYRETLRALVGRDPTFMAYERVAAPVADWSASDAVVEAARENGVAA